MVGKGTDKESTRRIVGEGSLDEISDKMKKRYVRRASRNSADLSYFAGMKDTENQGANWKDKKKTLNKIDNREVGIHRATKE